MLSSLDDSAQLDRSQGDEDDATGSIFVLLFRFASRFA
jgi:hypothetical protein